MSAERGAWDDPAVRQAVRETIAAERGPSGTGHDTAPEPFVCAACGNSFFDNDGCPDCTIQHTAAEPRVTEAAPAPIPIHAVPNSTMTATTSPVWLTLKKEAYRG